MKKYIYLMLSMVMAGIFASCSKDEPFDNFSDKATGQLSTRSMGLDVTVQNDGTRASSINVDDFTVQFFLDGAEAPEATYIYGKMPELVTLPVGHYTAIAFYGDLDQKAQFENPCYKGEVEFDIQANEITTVEETIVCSLANVKVTVVFDKTLQDVVGDDCVVTVKVGKHDSDTDAGVLDFENHHIADGKAGYFSHVENSNTLVAIFNGTVDGGKSTDIKTFNDVKPGTHYRILFKLHSAGDEDPGYINPDDTDGLITIEAVVDTEHIDRDIDSGDTTLKDDSRPQEGSPEPDEPSVPDVPGAEKPVIEVSSPYTMGGTINEIELNEDRESKYPVTLHVTSSSEKGFTGFKVKIDSNTLTKQELESVDLTDEFDLVNPGQYTKALQGLGFLEDGVDSLRGKTDVTLSITDFVPMLVALGEGTHKFILTVTDANGTTQDVLVMHNIEF